MNRSYAPPLTPGQLDALVSTSNHLRNLQRKLSKVEVLANPTQPVDTVGIHIDDRFAFGPLTTRPKKSGRGDGLVPDRSVVRPGTHPSFVPPSLPGTDTRWLDRGSEMVMDK